MSMLPEEKLIPQLRLGPRIGAIRELSAQALFYPNLLRGLLMYGVAYYNTPIQQFVPSWVFFASIPILYVAAGLGHYVIIHKAWVSFNATQSADDGVNPQYRRMIEEHRELREILIEMQEDDKIEFDQ